MGSETNSKAGPRRGGGETVILSDKTALLNNADLPLIFAWLVDQEYGRIWRIASDTFVIGADAANDLTLSGPDIKDAHCSVYFVDNRFEVNDHNTRSGTRVNGAAVKRLALADGDILEICSQRFRFKCFMGEGRG